MFSFTFAGILSLLENAPAEIQLAENVANAITGAAAPLLPAGATTQVTAAETKVNTVAVAVSDILANPAVQALEGLLGSLFTSTTTPGSAAVIEPVVSTTPKSAK